ncbi:helix-hairpin-helix domain-containing protein [Streptomyces sp. KR55]|uniref:helix-hairpin-helix domain-containing protein n=1 Tax=Streptomyces sp. KR55 TaxID=3457425 RepID=UPI003FD04DA5
MTFVISVQCDGRNKACPSELNREGRISALVVTAARSVGWTFPDGPEGRALCPNCTPAPPPGCGRCLVYVEFSDTVGHDRIGHMAVNKLASHGVSTWARLIELPVKELTAIKGLGDVAIGRVEKARQEHIEKARERGANDGAFPVPRLSKD